MLSGKYNYKRTLSYMELIGNAAHEGRNLMAEKKRIYLP